MRIALAVNNVVEDTRDNLAAIVAFTHRAAGDGADLVLFSEAALTGFVHTGDPANDLPLGTPVPGTATELLAETAHACKLFLAVGLLDRAGNTLHDAALLFAPDGTTALHYRRVSPQWHPRDADPSIYRQGVSLPVAETYLGSFAFLLCGDLFDDTLVARVRDQKPDWLLVPFARGFDEDVRTTPQWETHELPLYATQVARAGATTFLVNHTSAVDGSFGGAAAIAPNGDILARFPLHAPGLYAITLGNPPKTR